jgi:hypothetical protein
MNTKIVDDLKVSYDRIHLMSFLLLSFGNTFVNRSEIFDDPFSKYKIIFDAAIASRTLLKAILEVFFLSVYCRRFLLQNWTNCTSIMN